MLKQIRHYFSVYIKFIATSSSVALSFRTSFVLLVIMDIFFYLSSLGAVEFIFGHISHIGSWHKSELMFFISFMLLIDNLHMGLVSQNFWQFSFDLRSGMLDFILLRPLHSIFNIFFRNVRPSTILNFGLATYFCIHYGIAAGLTTMSWCLLPLLLLLAIILLVQMEIILCTLTFWLIQGNGINFLRMQMQQIGRWPDFVYEFWTRKFFTFFLPILLIGSAPVKFLLFPQMGKELILMLGAIIITNFIMFRFWKWGLKNYHSASS